MKTFLYYLLQFTYGILMNAIGLIVFLIVICFTHNVNKHCDNYYTITKTQFGGISFGIFMIVCKKDLHILNHETGHSYQNITFGPLFLFIVALPSVVRYWYRELRYYRRGKEPKTEYDDIWFEGQATNIGYKVYNKWWKKI